MTEPLHIKFTSLGAYGAGDALVRSWDVMCQWRDVVPKSQRAPVCFSRLQFNWARSESELFLWLEDCWFMS